MLYLEENGQWARGPISGPSSAPDIVVILGKFFLFSGLQFSHLSKKGLGKGFTVYGINDKNVPPGLDFRSRLVLGWGWGFDERLYPVCPFVGRPLQRDLLLSKPVNKALLRRSRWSSFSVATLPFSQWLPLLSLWVGPGECNSSAIAWDHVLGGVCLVSSGASSKKANAGLLAQPPLSPSTIRFLGSMVGWERSFWYMHACLWLCGMHWEDVSGYIYMCLEHVQPTSGPGTAQQFLEAGAST